MATQLLLEWNLNVLLLAPKIEKNNFLKIFKAFGNHGDGKLLILFVLFLSSKPQQAYFLQHTLNYFIKYKIFGTRITQF